MMKLGERRRKCRVALIAIAYRYSTHRLAKFASSLHARRNGGDYHRCHLELLGAIDDAVTCSDPSKVGVDRPNRAGAVLDHQKSHGPIQTGVRICGYELGAERRITKHQQRRGIEL